MITVYLDESGIHEGAPYKNWKKVFIPEWEKVLKRFGLENIGFHAKDFFARKRDEYKTWADSDATHCFNSLVNVINKAGLTPVGGGVVTNLFWKLTEEERRYITGGRFDEKHNKWLSSGAPKTPFHFPIQQAVVDAASMASPSNKAHFVHDQQKQYAPLVLERFKELKETLSVRDNLGDFVFSSRLDATPLQAADLIAYLATKYAERRLETGDSNVQPSYEFKRLMERPNNLRFLDEYSFNTLLDGCPPRFRTTQFALSR